MSAELLVLYVMVWGMVSLYFAHHSQKYGRTQLWALVVFLTGVIGIVIYVATGVDNHNTEATV